MTEPTRLHRLLVDLPNPDVFASDAVAERADIILRPAGALGRFDQIAAWLAGWQRTPRPVVARPAALIFAADHGVALDSDVSAYDPAVTASMLDAFRAGRSTVNAWARVAGASVTAVDVGVGKPTGDIRVEAALSLERFDEIVDLAVKAVDAIDADLLVIGEMGIGNTTAAAAVATALLPGGPAAWVGRGTGVDDDGLARKHTAVSDAVNRIASVTDPIEVLRQVGGSELVAIAAAVMAARHRSLPVVIDGYVVSASILPLFLLHPEAIDHCTFGHCSAEPGHEGLLERFGRRPLLDLGMRLGEASGAMAAVPLLAMACAGVTDVPTFPEWFDGVDPR
ncbi:MAG: nicotinate-nucleotide--dimethylbenzimidazole phosphoribosyltransferase [Aquihabitans sp.]